MPQLVVSARFVYVTTYDGPPWFSSVLPEERQAVADVEDALRAWGKYTVVLRPDAADLILVVQRRPTEDVLAVYQLGASIPLWRGMKEGGLSSKELPLMANFRKAVERAELQNRR